MATAAVGLRTALPAMLDVKAAMLAKLKESLLGSEDVRRLKFTPFLANEVARKLPTFPAFRAGFQIPYFGLDGRPTKFFRFRYLEYGNESGFRRLVAANARPLRYAQPPNSVNELYLPPYIDWQAYALDKEKPLIFTEGEFKAACATKSGYPTAGLGGVWCFKSSRSHLPLLPIFQHFYFKDRRAYICYDSDAATNVQVIKAENAFARELLMLGAFPYICRLPALEEGKKTGLDDFIAARGVDAFRAEVIDLATEWRAAQELFALNEEVVYVEDPGIILRLSTTQRMTPRAFADHAYSTRIYYEEQFNEAGKSRMLEKCAPKEWLKWPRRATVARITYAPGAERITEAGEYNVWKGWGAEPEKGDVGPWKRLMDYLFPKPENRAWFERWLAFPLQYPGTKLYQSAVVWGNEQGTGKSLVGYTMFCIYGRPNATEIGDKDLYATHNEWAENKQFVMGDEIAGGERKRDIADRMKSMITQRELRLNPKYIPSYTVPDCINYYFTSNHPDAFFMTDQDRRFFVNEVLGKPMAPEFYRAYMKWLDEDGGPARLFYYFLNLDVSEFDPSGPAPVTAAKKDMVDSGRSDLGTWVAALRDSPDEVLKDLGGRVVPYALWSAKELHALYDPNQQKKVTSNGLARELRRTGFRMVWTGPIRTAMGTQKLWAIREPDRLLAMTRPTEIAKLYETERANGNGARKKAKF